MFVKICGLTTEVAVAAAVAAGADAVGFVFAASPRQVTASRAAELTRNLPLGICRVAVMRHPQRDAWAEVCRVFRPDWLQTEHEDFAGLDVPAGIDCLPVYRDRADADFARDDAVLPPQLLYEGEQSGVGQQADWSRAAAIACRTRMLLAGGLNPQNVVAAIHQVRPWGVDVSSGVESRPGLKDPGKIAAFVQAARQAEDTHAG